MLEVIVGAAIVGLFWGVVIGALAYFKGALSSKKREMEKLIRQRSSDENIIRFKELKEKPQNGSDLSKEENLEMKVMCQIIPSFKKLL